MSREIHSKIAGVSHENEDGVSRQEIIKRYCKPGSKLIVETDPNNAFSKTAVKISVPTPKGPQQVGFVRDTDLDDEIFEALSDELKVDCVITEVTGGTPEKPALGVNVLYTIYDPEEETPILPATVPPPSTATPPTINQLYPNEKKPNRTLLIIIIVLAALALIMCCCIPMIMGAITPKPTPTSVNVEQARTQVAGTLLASASQTIEAGITPTLEDTETPAYTETAALTETPGLTETIAPTTDAYMASMSTKFLTFQDAYQRFQDLHQQETDDSSLLVDSTWKTKMGLTLGLLNLTSEDLTSLQAPTKYEKFNNYMIQLATATKLMTESYAKAIDNIDASQMRIATAMLEEMTSIMQKALVELNNIKGLTPTP